MKSCTLHISTPFIVSAFLWFLIMFPSLSIGQEDLSQKKSTKHKGYYNYTVLGYLFEFPEEDDQTGGNMVALYPQTIHGYAFSNLFSVGGGVGISMFQRGYTMPLLAEIRGDLGGKVSPHYYVQSGYVLPLYRRPIINGWWGEPIYEDYEISGSLVFDAGIGIKIRSHTGIAWVFTAGYHMQKTTERYKEWDFAWITQHYTHQRLSIKTGIMF